MGMQRPGLAAGLDIQASYYARRCQASGSTARERIIRKMSEGNGKSWGPEITDLGDKIVALTVAKAVELGNYLEEVHGIKPAASAVAMAPAGGGGAAVAEKPAEQTEFTVVLESF